MTDIRVIRPPGRWPTLSLLETFQSRELLWVFVRRGIFTRYRQMALGVLWSFLEPLGLLILMSLVFGMLIRVPTGDYPYPVFVFGALIPWLYFAKATQSAASSLHEHIGIISKIYFPRLILPLSCVIRELFDSAVLLVLLIVMSWIYGYAPNWKVLLLPLLFFYVSLPALGLGLAVAAISIKYRDFRPLLTIALQAGFYATPIFYPGELVPEVVRPFYQLNPMYWAVEISRWIMLDKPIVINAPFIASFALILAFVAIGYFVFAMFERGTVDAQ